MSGEPITILLVEDNIDHAELVIRGLETNRVCNRIIHVEDGESALDYMFQRGRFSAPGAAPRPHLVLLDLRLPRVDGLEVLKTLKSDDETKRVPVVILTTSDAESDMARAYRCQANSYLVKPVDLRNFTALMETFGYYWLAWNKFPF